MKRASVYLSRIALTVLTLGALALYFSRQVERSAPGDLSAVHQAVPELRGNAGCAACHGDGTAMGLERACLHCHATIRTQRAEGRGIHGRSPALRTEECATCHHEHRGAARAPTDERTWTRAEVKEWRSFDHANLDFRLEGVHTKLACTACHPNSDLQPLPAGRPRYAGLQQVCDSCHRDPHEGRLGEECARCHGQERPFAEVAAFTHDPRFPLTGGHGQLACRSCHAEGSRRSLESLAKLQERPSVRACAACHQNPHEASPQATLVLPDTRDCARCHDTTKFRGATFGVAEHRAIGVVLAGRHATAACAKCHAADVAGRSAGAAAPMGRCEVCHPSPHREEFAKRGEQRACAACHDAGAESFASTDESRSRAAHAAIGVDLGPPHQKVACTGCHAPAGGVQEFAARFPGRSLRACETCHGDPHRGQLVGSPAAAGGCLACHEAVHFAPAKFGPHEHASTRFPLEGAHRATACDRCHPFLPEAPGAPRTRKLRPLATECARCHQDPHGGAFDGPTRPAQVQGRAGCARCHTADSFRTIARDFDHGRWTGYELVGKHALAACTSCHAPLANALGNGKTYAAAPKECARCHDDVHAGQFANLGPNGCARCHDASATFAKVRFDHDRDSRFPLDATHRALACAACHRPYRTPSGASIVRYKPLGTKCAECHDPERLRGKR